MNCKPGDLAIVVAARNTPEIIGRIVEVVRVAVAGDTFKRVDGVTTTLARVDGVTWRVRSSRPLPWTMANGKTYQCFEVATSDAHLRPVSGLPVCEETRDTVHA